MKKKVLWLAVVLFLALIVGLTFQTPRDTVALSSAVERLIAPWYKEKVVLPAIKEGRFYLRFRQAAHIGEYAVLGILAGAAFGMSDKIKKRKMLYAELFCICCSLADQNLKRIVPGREFDRIDLFCDAVGYTIGVAAVFGIALVMRKMRNKKQERQLLRK